MLLSVHNWQFDVDVSLNMEISSAQAADHCLCGYCRNFYAAIDSACPSMRAFLAQFGADIEGPDELSPFEPTIYEASYIINGTIRRTSDFDLSVDGIPVRIVKSENADMDTVRSEPYFVLVIGLIKLPWVLDEDPLEVISPANEEAYLRRMEKKLLDRLGDEILPS